MFSQVYYIFLVLIGYNLFVFLFHKCIRYLVSHYVLREHHLTPRFARSFEDRYIEKKIGILNKIAKSMLPNMICPGINNPTSPSHNRR